MYIARALISGGAEASVPQCVLAPYVGVDLGRLVRVDVFYQEAGVSRRALRPWRQRLACSWLDQCLGFLLAVVRVTGPEIVLETCDYHGCGRA